MQAIEPVAQHLPLKQPVPLGQQRLGTPDWFAGHTDWPDAHFCAGLQVLVDASAQPQSQQLLPQFMPVRQSGAHSLPLTQPAGQQAVPQMCSVAQQVSGAVG